jgi:hypothetical protein
VAENFLQIEFVSKVMGGHFIAPGSRFAPQSAIRRP